MVAQNPTSKSRYVPDDEVVASPPSDARVEFLRREGSNLGSEWTTLDQLGGAVGGTDNDGNVYSLFYDPGDHALQIQCVTPVGDAIFIEVSPTTATLAISPDAGGEKQIEVDAVGVSINGIYVDPSGGVPGEGWFFALAADGTIRLSQPYLKAPDGGIWYLTVDNTGHLGTTPPV